MADIQTKDAPAAVPVQKVAAPAGNDPTTRETTADATSRPGLTAVTEVRDGVYKGSSGDDRGTLAQLIDDKDHVISLGAGNDVFVYRESLNGTETKFVNGIVDMGTGTNDRVFLEHGTEDYLFSIRSDGGIKFEYIGGGEAFRSAVTFQNADTFTFRNVVNPGEEVGENGRNLTNVDYTYEQMVAKIQAWAEMSDLI